MDTTPSSSISSSVHVFSLLSILGLSRAVNILLYSDMRILANSMAAPSEQRIFKLQSEICKVLSNPGRLLLLHALRDGEKTVTELMSETGIKQANVSQHLTMMRVRGMVTQRRDGNSVYYRISDQRIIKACDVMQSFLLDHTSEDSKLVKMAVTSLRQ